MVVRRLAAILALDVVGYSHRMAVNELGTLDQLHSLKNETLFPAFQQWHGRVFKEMGDGMLVEFASVVDAVECAHHIQHAASADTDGSPDSTLPLRIGIHFGEIIVEEVDLFGDTVNIAARIEAAAEPGGIWISEQAYELLGNRVDLAFRPAGAHKLKNIPAPVQLYALASPGSGAAGTRPHSAAGSVGRFVHSKVGLMTAGAIFLLLAGLGYFALPLIGDRGTTVASDRTLPENLTHTKEFTDCDLCPKMVAIAGGHLLMGAPAEDIKAGTFTSDQGPQRLVAIPAFAVGKFELTRKEFDAFLVDTGHQSPTGCRTWEDGSSRLREERSYAKPGYEQDETHPAVCISWADAQAYVDWLTRKTGKTYRMLSEAEWEFVARAGSDERFFFGDNENDLCRYDNIGDATAHARWPNWETADCSDGRLFTAPVGSYQANPFGVHDIYGNAREWVRDCWHNTFDDAPETSEARITGACKERVIRGGSWDSKPSLVASTWRGRLPATHRDFLYGLRIARDLTQ